MGIFYIDLEFTNSNYYLSDIIEIAAKSEDSGYTYNVLISIDYIVPPYISYLTGLTYEYLQRHGIRIEEALHCLEGFINREQSESTTPLLIVAHGGELSDFPIIFANYEKCGVEPGCLDNATYLDSMLKLRNAGIERPGLQNMAKAYKIPFTHSHTAMHDVEMLETICAIHRDIIFDGEGILDSNTIKLNLGVKLVIPIRELQSLTRTTKRDVVYKQLLELSSSKTSLPKKLINEMINLYSQVF